MARQGDFLASRNLLNTANQQASSLHFCNPLIERHHWTTIAQSATPICIRSPGICRCLLTSSYVRR